MDYSRLPAYPGESEPPPWPRQEGSRDLCETTILMTLLFFAAGLGSLFALWLTAYYFEVYLRNLREFIAKPVRAIGVVEIGFTESVDIDGLGRSSRGGISCIPPRQFRRRSVRAQTVSFAWRYALTSDRAGDQRCGRSPKNRTRR